VIDSIFGTLIDDEAHLRLYNENNCVVSVTGKSIKECMQKALHEMDGDGRFH
jgi:hypothetical protein